MMLGAVDVGKTTTATALAGAAVRAGLRTAIVDADIGQSDLGPPATVGLGVVRRPVRHMADVPPSALYFVGDTSPQRVYGYVVDGTRELTARARRQGAQIVVVDTTGWVAGTTAVAAKLRKIRRLSPRHVVAIQRDREVEPILVRLSPRITVHRLYPETAGRARSAAERRAFRERKFAEYFERARPMVLDLRRLIAERSPVYAGTPVAPSRVPADVPPDALRHLLVGLAGRRGTMRAMGTVLLVEPELHRLTVLAPDVSRDAVSSVQWGVLRVTPAGREHGRLSDTAGASP